MESTNITSDGSTSRDSAGDCHERLSSSSKELGSLAKRSRIINSKPKATDHSSKPRPKLPLYSSNSRDFLQQTKNVTVDEILQSVKALDEKGLHKQRSKTSSLDSCSSLKSLIPCSSLHIVDVMANPYNDDSSSQFNDKSHTRQSTEGRNKPVLSVVEQQCSVEEVPNSENNVTFLSLSGSQIKFDLAQRCYDTGFKENPTTGMVIKTQRSNFREDIKDLHSAPEKEMSPIHEIEEPQFSSEQEASAASSVLDVSDFLTCAKKPTRFDSSLGGSSAEPDNLLFKKPASGVPKKILTTPDHVQIPLSIRKQLNAHDKCSAQTQGNLQPSGFSTAGGKDIGVSAKSLAFASQIFEKIDDDDSLKTNNDVPSASRDSVDVQPSFTEDVHSTGKCSESVNLKEKPLESHAPQNGRHSAPTQGNLQPSGFSTAGGKDVGVSAKSLAFASQIYEKIDGSLKENNDIPSTPHDSVVVQPSFTEDVHSNGKCSESVHLKEKPLDSHASQNGRHSAPTQGNLQPSGFSTAGGKDIGVSAKSLAFASQIFEKIDDDEILKANNDVPSASQDSVDVQPSFTEDVQSTGKCSEPVHLKEKPLESHASQNGRHSAPTQGNLQPSGFSTADGKNVNVSAESMAFASQIFEKIDGSLKENNDIPSASHDSMDSQTSSIGDACSSKHPDSAGPHSPILFTQYLGATEPTLTSSKMIYGADDSASNNKVGKCQSITSLLSSNTLNVPTVKNDSLHALPEVDDIDNPSALNEADNISIENVGGPHSPIILNTYKGTQSTNQLSKNDAPDSGRSPVLLGCSKSSFLDEDLKSVTFEASSLKHNLPGPEMPLFGAGRCVSPILMSNVKEELNPSGNLGVVDKILNSGDIPNDLNFSSAAGKRIQPSRSSFAKIKGLLADIFDEKDSNYPDGNSGLNLCEDKEVVASKGSQSQNSTQDDTDGTKSDGNDGNLLGEMGESSLPSCSQKKTEAVFSSNEVSLENVRLARSECRISEGEELSHLNCSPNRSRSPVLLNCSFVAVDDDESGIGKPNKPTPSNISKQHFGSPDWEDFPDLKSSQADLLEADAFQKENQNVPKHKKLRLACAKPVSSATSPLAPTHEVKAAPRQLELPSSAIGNVEADALGKRKSRDSLEGRRKKVRHSLDINFGVQMDSKTISNSKGTQNFRQLLREQQKALIQAKRNQKITPCLGILSARKTAPLRPKLEDLDSELKMVVPGDATATRIKQCVIGVSSENAVHFRFKELAMTPDGSTIADSCLIAYADDGTAGVDEVCSAFLTCPNVDPKLVPDGWVKNHYRWIVWKLAAFERTFPQHFSGRCLTLETVLLQLKYRYDREIDLVQRSAFKKILEGDAAPSKFVCCIASVKQNNLDEGESLLEFELTDGWYSFWSNVDTEMITLYRKDVVSVGTKLIVHGAEIINCDQGCDPLNVPACVKVKISTNSVRRAKWFGKLGFEKANTPIPSLLCSVLPNGGLIGHLTAVIVRKYPIIYMCKDADGKTVFRSERSQAMHQELQEKSKSDKAEQVYDKVWKEVESKYHPSKLPKKYSTKEIKSLTDPAILFRIVDGADGEFIQSQLSADQLRSVLNYKNEVEAKMKNDVQRILQDKLSESSPASRVTKLLKVRLMDLFTDKHALLTVWRPSDDDLSFLREDKAFEFYNLIASGTRDKVLQLSSHRQTNYEPNDVVEASSDFRRTLSPLSAFEETGFAPKFGEVDTVGLVVLVKLPEQSRGVTVVYLSDLEGHYLSITFWTSLSVFGCGDLMTEGSLVACSNLQWRSVSNQRKIPSVFASEITSFSLNPKQQHLRQGISQLKSRLSNKDTDEMIVAARSFVAQSIKLKDFSASPSPSPQTPKSSTPTAQKMRALLRYDEVPTSPLPPLTVASRHVFNNFKSPTITPQRRHLT